MAFRAYLLEIKKYIWRYRPPYSWTQEPSGPARIKVRSRLARFFWIRVHRNSQAGRNALPESAYAHVFSGQPIGAALTEELQRRRAAKESAAHMDMAP